LPFTFTTNDNAKMSNRLTKQQNSRTFGCHSQNILQLTYDLKYEVSNETRTYEKYAQNVLLPSYDLKYEVFKHDKNLG
jgi:hypothetical protein